MTILWNRLSVQRGSAAAAMAGVLLASAACGGGEQAESPEETADPDQVSETITLAEVEEHGSPESCWAAIDQTVYDLTDWIAAHPGGPSRIEQLCGTDATSEFTGQHAGQERPEAQLTEFEIGTLAD